MAGKSRPWWQNFQVLAYIGCGVAALTVLGTFIVKSAEYIKLPEAVAEQVKRNDTQDQRLDKLITLQEFYQQQQQQAVPNAPAPQVQEWRDPETGTWYCCHLDQNCERDENWYRC